MAFYTDLSRCDYFGRWQEVLIAVGWLEQGHASATGTVSKEFFEQLVGLLTDPWQPAVTEYRRGSARMLSKRGSTSRTRRKSECSWYAFSSQATALSLLPRPIWIRANA